MKPGGGRADPLGSLLGEPVIPQPPSPGVENAVFRPRLALTMSLWGEAHMKVEGRKSCCARGQQISPSSRAMVGDRPGGWGEGSICSLLPYLLGTAVSQTA